MTPRDAERRAALEEVRDTAQRALARKIADPATCQALEASFALAEILLRFPAPEAAPEIQIDNVCHPEEIRRAHAVGRTEAFERAARTVAERAARLVVQDSHVAHELRKAAAEIRKEAGIPAKRVEYPEYDPIAGVCCAETRRKTLAAILEAIEEVWDFDRTLIPEETRREELEARIRELDEGKP